MLAQDRKEDADEVRDRWERPSIGHSVTGDRPVRHEGHLGVAIRGVYRWRGVAGDHDTMAVATDGP